MGLLKFTKTYSASDDGSTFTGAEIGQIESDIAAILNGGISNVNVASDAAIVESKLTFDTSSGHNHDGSNSRVISSGAYRAFRQGAGLVYVTAATMKAQSGVLEISGSVYTRTSYSSTINMATDAHWVEGTTQEAASQTVYIYAYNDSGTTWDIKFWLQAPQYANTVSDDSSVKIFRSNAGVWYRCLGYFYNDSSQNIQSKTIENIDGELTYGTWWTTDKDGSAWANNTTYQALTDGYVWAKSNGQGDNTLYTDSSNPPTTITDYSASDAAAIGFIAVRSLVKRNDYWKVNCIGGINAIKWLPLMRATIT